MSILIKGMEMPINCTRCPCSNDETRFCNAVNEYIPMIGKPNFCPLEEMPLAQQWIPCSERLPEIGQYVICQCRAGIIDVLALDNDGIWFHDTEQEYYHDYVIAYMPLPEPYKGADA